MTKINNYLSPWKMALFVLSAGILVGNQYYIQPLLLQISQSLNISIENAGYLVTFFQLGYAFGVLLIIPLGDYRNRKNLISIMLPICSLSLLVIALNSNFLIFSIASFITGLTSSATMIVIPYVASHSSEESRGKNVGQVMTGLFLGILLARTLSGYIAYILGWRYVYIIASILVFTLMFLIRKAMVSDEIKGEKIKYKNLMLSLWTLLLEESELRWRSWYSFLALLTYGQD